MEDIFSYVLYIWLIQSLDPFAIRYINSYFSYYRCIKQNGVRVEEEWIEHGL